MAISLQKGGNVNLSKEAPTMKAMLVGLGWDARATDGASFDLDASAFVLGATGKVANDSGFIFYNNKKSADGAIEHTGDNQSGAGDGDDEVIKIDLSKIASDTDKIAFSVTIHEAEARKQNFGMVSKAYIRIVDSASNQEVMRYDLSEDASVETAMIFGELYRAGADWKFKAIGQGFKGGLGPLAKNFGVNT
jgi:tellurium resistance protein TerD